MSKIVDALVWDMDGTIADLYSVDEWEPKLRASDPSPYLDAEPLVDMAALRELLQRAKSMNIRIITVSWSSMNGTVEYGREVRKAKKQWLETHCPELLEELHVVKYGTDKYSLCKGLRAVLIDDNETVRASWPFDSIDASDSLTMLETLAALLDECKPKTKPIKAKKDYGKAGYRTIPIAPNYACSKNGKVINRKTGNELKHHQDKNERYYVNLEGKKRSLHRVVALTWCRGNLTVEDCVGLEVHHKNHDKTDNRAANLIWYAHDEHREEHGYLTNYLRHCLATDWDGYERWKYQNMK